MVSINLDHAVKYHYGKFPPRSLRYDKFLDPLLRATEAIARYDQMLKSMRNSEILLAPLRNQEAVISSRMEGTISTMDEILEYQSEISDDAMDDEGSDLSNFRTEVVETFLYQRALKSAQNAMSDGYPLSANLIRQIHSTLLSFGRGASKSPGQFKTEQNYLADRSRRNIKFVPIEPERLPEGMDVLFDYIAHNSHSPLVKAALAHIEFEALHPFQDGNGRIGRMLITLMLWSSQTISQPHFYISGYLEEHKDEYIDTMRRVSEKGDWDNWCAFFLTAVEHQAEANLAIAESIMDLYEEMKQVFSEVLSSKWSMAALDYVFTNPVFRNNRFTSRSGIPQSSASRFTRILSDEGLITTRIEASGQRPALYSFEPLMQVVRI